MGVSAGASKGDTWLWLALAVGLSPGLVDLGSHWAAEPWGRPFALVAVLALAAAVRDPRRAVPRPLGYALVALGLLAVLVAVGGGMARLGRPGIPVAILGLALALGRPVVPIALLAALVVPPPHALLDALAPGLETALAELAAAATRALGGTAALGKDGLELNGSLLRLEPADGGLPIAWVLAAVGWWSAIWRGGGAGDALRGALRTAPWALVAQPLALAGAFALTANGAPGAARTLLDLAAWPALALALAWGARRPPVRARKLLVPRRAR